MRNKGLFTAYLPELQDLTIGIYFGGGASHSWTWLVDCFESQGFYNLTFLDEGDIRRGGLSKVDVLAMGGGDAFAIAEALWHPGARAVASFITQGGLYLGFCAGTYLLLDMDEFPLSIFALTRVKVKNIVEQLPPARSLPSKLFTPYGQRYVLHPVREGVLLHTTVKDIFETKELVAPLYGGPPMEPGGEEEVLAVYQDFTPQTIFLVDEQMAREMMLGTVAACRRKIGQGWVYLFGPHLENPQYPEANAVLGRIIIKHGRKSAKNLIEAVPPAKYYKANEQLVKKIKSHLSNARIVAFSLEFVDVAWQLGYKIYEPAKILVFLETMWRRYEWAARNPVFGSHDKLVELEQGLQEVVVLLRSIKKYLRENKDTLPLARRLFPLLKEVTGNFLKAYFAARLFSFKERD